MIDLNSARVEKEVITTASIRIEFIGDEVRELKRLSDNLRRLTFHMKIGWVREMYLSHASMGRIMTRAINRARAGSDPKQRSILI